jgi:hypothetical protein
LPIGSPRSPGVVVLEEAVVAVRTGEDELRVTMMAATRRLTPTLSSRDHDSADRVPASFSATIGTKLTSRAAVARQE